MVGKQESLEKRLARLISGGGPIPVSLYMSYANAQYYATRDPLGIGGDFITAPEISQMFGELIGLWAADLILRAASPTPPALVELGPGRGTLMADVVRAMDRVGMALPVHFVETSPVLRDLQAAAVPHARFHDDVTTLPEQVPLVIIANEFFDALPIRQLVRGETGWRERMIGYHAGKFGFTQGDVPMDAAIPPMFGICRPGAILESSPASAAIARDLALRLARQGGAMLAIDYGYTRLAPGETLQALSDHQYADVLDQPGERDLTAHVDFEMLARIGQEAQLAVHGPETQGQFLRGLGVEHRTHTLMRSNPMRADALEGECNRLIADKEMGQLFKVIAYTAPTWPVPEGFGE